MAIIRPAVAGLFLVIIFGDAAAQERPAPRYATNECVKVTDALPSTKGDHNRNLPLLAIGGSYPKDSLRLLLAGKSGRAVELFSGRTVCFTKRVGSTIRDKGERPVVWISYAVLHDSDFCVLDDKTSPLACRKSTGL